MYLYPASIVAVAAGTVIAVNNQALKILAAVKGWGQ